MTNIKRSILLLLANVCLSMQANAGLVTVQMDNDVVYGTDEQYTGGMKVRLSEAQLWAVNSMITPMETVLPKKWHSTQTAAVSDQLTLGVEIYTINLKKTSNPQDKLSSAWTYFDLQRRYQFAQSHQSIALRLGWLGPSNHGEAMHNFVHQLIGNSKPEGWQKQLHDQPTLQLMAETQNTFYRANQNKLNVYTTASGLIGSPETRVTLGIGTYYSTGPKPKFSFHELQSLPISKDNTGWFISASLSGIYDIYHLLRDGRLFTQDRPLVKFENKIRLEARYCAGWAFENFSISFSGTMRPRVYDTEIKKVFRFASLSLSVPWGI